MKHCYFSLKKEWDTVEKERVDVIAPPMSTNCPDDPSSSCYLMGPTKRPLLLCHLCNPGLLPMSPPPLPPSPTLFYINCHPSVFKHRLCTRNGPSPYPFPDLPAPFDTFIINRRTKGGKEPELREKLLSNNSPTLRHLLNSLRSKQVMFSLIMIPCFRRLNCHLIISIVYVLKYIGLYFF